MIEPTFSPATPPPEEDVTTALYRSAIGPLHVDYYLPIFTRFEAAGRAGISWNTSACLWTLNWLVFRKLWIAALSYVGIIVTLFLLVFGIGWVVFEWPDALIMALALGFGLAAFVLPGFFGNALLHGNCRKRMAKALVSHSVVAEACADLQRQASSHQRALWLTGANVAVLVTALISYFAYSALHSVTAMPTGAVSEEPVAAARAPGHSTPSSLPTAVAPAAPTSASGPISIATLASAPASSLSAPPAATASTPTAVAVPVGPVAAAVPASSASKSSAPTEPAKAAAPPPSTNKVPARGTAKQASGKAVQTEKHAKLPPPAVASRRAASATASTSTIAGTADKPFFINVGLFAKPENAAKAHAKLLEAQLASVTKTLKSSKGPLTRVRVGPFASQAEALAAVEKIKALQLDAVVVQP